MAVGGGVPSVIWHAQGTDSRRANPEMAAGMPRVGSLPAIVAWAGRQMLMGVCFRCRKAGHWKSECPDRKGVSAQGCFTCRGHGHLSRDCARRVRLDLQAVGGNKDKERMGHRLDDRRRV